MRGSTKWMNWSTSQSCVPSAVASPRKEHEIVAVLARAVDAGLRVRVVGAGRSFAPLVPSRDVLLRLDQYRGLVRLDPSAGQATFLAGTTVEEANTILSELGFALRTLGTSRKATLAGIVATGTHGSGTQRPCVAADVSSFTLVTATGEVLQCDRETNAEVFACGRISLGVLGVVSEITFRIVPAFTLLVERHELTPDELSRRAPQMVGDWTYATAWWNLWTDKVVAQRAEPVTTGPGKIKGSRAFIEERIAAGLLRRSAVASGVARTRFTPAIVRAIDAIGSAGQEVLPSPAVLTVAQNVRFVAAEYAIPLNDLGAAMAQIRTALAGHARQLPWPIEIRMSEGDDIPSSLAEGRRTAYLNLPVSPRYAGGSAVLEQFGGAFEELDARPHLAKIHYMSANQLYSRYPSLARLDAVRRTVDPKLTFGNDYVDQLLDNVS
jgi:L-gulonolactone oxidase